jgi:hypothetical protein
MCMARGSNSTTSNPCLAGSYCPSASANNAQLACPAGYYCLAGQSSGTTRACPAGFYCPLGTSSATQFPCEAGTTSVTGSSACSLVTVAQWTAAGAKAGTMGDAVQCPTTAKTLVAGCRGTAFNVTGTASSFQTYTNFSIPTAGADAELRFRQTAVTAAIAAPTSASTNYVMYCAPASTSSTAYNALSFVVWALASEPAFDYVLGGFFGVCNGGVVTPALAG